MSVRPQKVSSIAMKFGMYVEVDEWCTRYAVWPDPRSRLRALQSWLLCHLQWELATDHGFL